MTSIIVLVVIAAAFAGLVYWRKKENAKKPTGYSYDPDQDQSDPLNPGPQPPNPHGND
jgi:hypothetical protein